MLKTTAVCDWHDYLMSVTEIYINAHKKWVLDSCLSVTESYKFCKGGATLIGFTPACLWVSIFTPFVAAQMHTG